MARNGILATLGLLTLYAATMSLLNGIDAAIEQFQTLWYLMLPLAIGFGAQVALYTKLRRRANYGGTMAGGASAGLGMLACCAHHAADVLPVIGITTMATLIGAYQKPILIMSLGINALGILYLIRIIRKTSCN